MLALFKKNDNLSLCYSFITVSNFYLEFKRVRNVSQVSKMYVGETEETQSANCDCVQQHSGEPKPDYIFPIS